ncbi:ribonuclease HI family protein [Candidatus Gracilibacteria bacterium]|nr:ribonuclease HI family protein [Candidatus Gracilibacteria bacterium]
MNTLFAKIDKSFTTKKEKNALLMCDGGSRGNPGIAGAGFVIFNKNNKEISRGGGFCGIQTNNFAEYTSLILGLQKALELGITHLKILMDSKLAIEQMKGNWKVKNINIKPLNEKANMLAEQFQEIKFQHIPREKNKAADAVANEYMDRQ